MKVLIAICLAMPFLAFAQSESQETAKTGQRTVKADDKRPAGVPAEAVEVEAGAWRHTDAEGKTWTYRLTPFGLMKGEVALSVGSEDLPPGMVALGETADEVRFERPSPFGQIKWSQKKSALNEVERRVWERDSKKGYPAPKPVPQQAPKEAKPTAKKAGLPKTSGEAKK